MKKNKKLITAALVLAALAVTLYAVNVHMTTTQADEDAAATVSLSGIVVCLPPNGLGPHTKECAIGLMTPDRKHYALDLSRVTMMEGGLQVSDRLTANGEVLPPASDEKYDIVGTFSITDSLVIE